MIILKSDYVKIWLTFCLWYAGSPFCDFINDVDVGDWNQVMYTQSNESCGMTYGFRNLRFVQVVIIGKWNPIRNAKLFRIVFAL